MQTTFCKHSDEVVAFDSWIHFYNVISMPAITVHASTSLAAVDLNTGTKFGS
jgi:hypothetical protein